MRKLTLATLTLLLAAAVALIASDVGDSRTSGQPAHRAAMAVPESAGTPTVAPMYSTPESPVSSSAQPTWAGAAEEFVQTFLDTSSSRTTRLDAIASPRLAVLLARTDPGKIPKAKPSDVPRLVDDTGSVVTVSQQLSDGSAFSFDLVPDTTRQAGWVVTSVRPGER
ncbi:hypothetical protein GCM10011575_41940 [Microlunatus endophyticus]|uniref:Uncharacterized protein n=1 Tax=Microlunatus endophyticus TaxID=1716077 RepID=A0A917W7C3_9ACTN|nr:hypothetical protein [Microlunatus endophyticus]GGL79163.1 hypothetical protein GCM10011575_41940 [Microlunatus endophyticus]